MILMLSEFYMSLKTLLIGFEFIVYKDNRSDKTVLELCFINDQF